MKIITNINSNNETTIKFNQIYVPKLSNVQVNDEIFIIVSNLSFITQYPFL